MESGVYGKGILFKSRFCTRAVNELPSAMVLTKFLVENFKSVDHSNEVEIGRVTCLMGKNESGKTTLLEALYKLNPVEEEDSKFVDLEYPRKRLADLRTAEGIATRKVITTWWELTAKEIETIEQLFHKGFVQSPIVEISKGYNNMTYYSYQFDIVGAIKRLFKEFKLDASEQSQLNTDDILELYQKLIAIPTKSEKQKAIQAKLERISGKGKVLIHISRLLPKFLYFDTYNQLPGKISLNDIKSRKDANQLNFGDRIFLALLSLAGTKLEDVEGIDKRERLYMELEAIQNMLTTQIFEYWSQNDHLEVQFRFDNARPGDPPPFNKGYIFETRIHNRRHAATVNFDERSTGFIWFFSFLIWFSQVRKNYGQNLIILLDEPGLSLHGKAQQDLLRYFKEKLEVDYQLLYSSHSPFMIDTNNIFSLRSVEDVVEEEEVKGKIVQRNLGTKVSKEVFGRDPETLFALQGICGFDITSTLFVGPWVIVVEGLSEFLLFHWFTRELRNRNRTFLDMRFAICPAESSSKISSFITLFKGRGLEIAALFDYHEPQKKLVNDLKKNGLVEEERVLITTDFVNQSDADIEDLLGRELYRYLINASLNLRPEHEFPINVMPDANVRLNVQAKEFSRTLPVYYPAFNHYLPIKYLVETEQNKIASLPGLEFALDAFEKLFKKLNSLLR